jgi:hypothetical protein
MENNRYAIITTITHKLTKAGKEKTEHFQYVGKEEGARREFNTLLAHYNIIAEVSQAIKITETAIVINNTETVIKTELCKLEITSLEKN